MELVGILLIVAGGLVMIVGGLWFLVVTFEEGVGWGLACMFIPFVSLIFLILHWDRAGKPFLVQLAGAVPLFIGLVLSGPAGN